MQIFKIKHIILSYLANKKNKKVPTAKEKKIILIYF